MAHCLWRPILIVLIVCVWPLVICTNQYPGNRRGHDESQAPDIVFTPRSRNALKSAVKAFLKRAKKCHKKKMEIISCPPSTRVRPANTVSLTTTTNSAAAAKTIATTAGRTRGVTDIRQQQVWFFTMWPQQQVKRSAEIKITFDVHRSSLSLAMRRVSAVHNYRTPMLIYDSDTPDLLPYVRGYITRSPPTAPVQKLVSALLERQLVACAHIETDRIVITSRRQLIDYIMAACFQEGFESVCFTAFDGNDEYLRWVSQATPPQPQSQPSEPDIFFSPPTQPSEPDFPFSAPTQPQPQYQPQTQPQYQPQTQPQPRPSEPDIFFPPQGTCSHQQQGTTTPAQWQGMAQEQLKRVWQVLWHHQLKPGEGLRWFKQGFVWSDLESSAFGLSQTHAGPSGVLAAVQAIVLKHLIFADKSTASILQPDSKTRDDALVNALSDILYQSVPKDTSTPRVMIVACPYGGGQSCSFTADCYSHLTVDLTNKNYEDAMKAIRAQVVLNLGQYHGPSGVVLFVMAVLLSRGLAVVIADMDAPAAVTTQLGSCTQELVNLLLLGAAHSQVFDGTRTAGAGKTLRGVLRQPEIGFLSFQEAEGKLKVGSFFKYPRYPIYVVSSGVHYTTLFGTDPSIVEQTPEEKLSATVARSFDKLDPENKGFVAMRMLASLLSTLGDVLPQTNEVRDYIRNNVGKRDPSVVSRSRFEEVAKEALDTFGGDAGAVRQQLKNCFEVYDQRKNGVIHTADLTRVIDKIKSTIPPSKLRDAPIYAGFGAVFDSALTFLKAKMDPEFDGIIRWPQFDAQAKIYLLRPKTKTKTLSKIEMVYYNGFVRPIDSSHSGPQVTELQLVQTGDEERLPFNHPLSLLNSEAQQSQLERVIRTRFTNVIIIWNSGQPPNING